MKKIVLIYGFIAGTISAALLVFGMISSYNDPNYSGSMVLGYAFMLLAFSMLFVGIKVFRDKHNDGVLTFKQGFTMGAMMALITATMYVAAWALLYHYYMPDYMTRYAERMVTELKNAHASEAKIAAKVKEAEYYKGLYSNPIYFALITYMEILPLGLVVSVISALILKRKEKPTAPTA
jgi:hypothetical protein